MSVSLPVAADVVDLRGDTPRDTDRFYVDTNVWYWTTYSRASQLPGTASPLPYQIRDYPQYIGRALHAGSFLGWSAASVAELAHVIGRAERTLLNARLGIDVGIKEFRRDYADEREDAVAEIQAAWGSINSIGSIIDMDINHDLIANALIRLSSEPLDGYDALVVEHLCRSSIRQVITDDSDFAAVSGLTVFTAIGTSSPKPGLRGG